MSSEILKVVGQVAGIGGIALGVLLLVFREVIRKTIFPTLTKEQGYRLLKLIVVLVWAIAVFGIAAWVFVETRLDPSLEPGRIDVTDVFVDDYRADFSAIVDFRLTNRGNRPLSLSRVRFDVVEVEELLLGVHLTFQPSMTSTLVI